ncbi:MAG: 50S ribosomal protein L1 [Candidatus Komeilibacteria bacterium]
MKISKRMQAQKAKLEAGKVYPLAESIALVKDTSGVKFDATIEVHVKLGIDPKQSDQLVRATVALPHGTGKSVKVAAFVPEDLVAEAKKAGADIVGNKELIEEIKKTGKCDFAVAIATPDMMKDLSAIARILGQKGLMPNPKTGTITTKVGQTVTELKAGKISFKNDSFGNVHVVIGKVSFDPAKLTENFEAFAKALKSVKPEKMKGIYIKGIYLTSSMGPAIKVSL